MKKAKFLLVIMLVVAFIFGGYKVLAEEEVTTTGEENTTTTTERTPMTVIMFRGEGCPHCEEALEWFDSIEGEYGQYFDLETYEVWNNQENAELMDKVAEYLGESPDGVPYIIIGKKTYSGFAQSYAEDIKKDIMNEYNKNLEERINVVYNVQNGVELEKEKDNSTAIIFILFVLAVVAFIIFARNGQDPAKIELEKKADKEEILVDDEEDEEEVEEKTSKKQKTNNKKEEKEEKKEKNTKVTSKSKKSTKKSSKK